MSINDEQEHPPKPTPCEMLVIRPFAEPETVEGRATVYWDTGLEPELAYLREQIGCQYVNVVRLSHGDLWVDDSGMINGSAPNEHASRMAQTPIYGTAVFVPRVE